MPAQSPPIVWLIIAFPVSSLAPRLSIIAMCVERYPLQHIQIAVKTAISFGPTRFCSTRFGTRPIAAPALPRAVIGTAIDSGFVNPKSGLMMNEIFLPSHGRNATPSFAPPV